MPSVVAQLGGLALPVAVVPKAGQSTSFKQTADVPPSGTDLNEGFQSRRAALAE